MNQPLRLLDLFCGAGGAAMGYSRAGFSEIVGVDIKPQPRYPFTFVLGDALEYVAAHGREFDAIHASPPCQGFSFTRFFHKDIAREDLLTPTRTLLDSIGRPWIIENVVGAPMRKDFTLCGTMFGLPRLQRHRHFESSVQLFALLPPHNHEQEAVTICGHGGPTAGRCHTPSVWRKVMNIGWMDRDELSQAIPPAYTEFIGKQLIQHLQAI